MKIGIVGVGHVGSAMFKLFPDAFVYDEPLGIGTRDAINECDIAFVCVPTPAGDDGSCDTSIVESVIRWVESRIIVLRSTVPVGFTDIMKATYYKKICFQPEYYGETVAHPFADLKDRHWITIGGDVGTATEVVSAYRHVYTSELIVNIVDAKTAELAKYMENSFLALKVTFCNEFYDLAQSMGVSYEKLRETWLLDPRMNRSHTFVYPDSRGFGGSCLPKDTEAIVSQGHLIKADVSLMEAVIAKNKKIQSVQQKDLNYRQ